MRRKNGRISDDADRVVKDIKRQTRRRLSAEEKIKGLSSVFMRRALAYQCQVKAFDGLSKAVKRQLKQVLKDLPAPAAEAGGNGKKEATIRKIDVLPTPLLKAGTQLVRAWHGCCYTVDVTEDGFVLDGKTYRSLSAVAERITGTKWSGPRFFGLRQR